MGTPATVPQARAQSNVNVMAANDQARRLLVRRAVTMTQEIYSNQVNPQQTQILNIVPRNVGIIKRFLIEITGLVTFQPAASQGGTNSHYVLTQMGVANLISNVTFYDLQNNLRINTTGAHLYLLSSFKRKRLWFANQRYWAASGSGSGGPSAGNAFAASGLPGEMLNETLLEPWMVPSNTVGAGTPPTAPVANGVQAYWEVPCSYSDIDLRGAIFANVVNTTMSLQITLQPVVSTTGNDTFLSVMGPDGQATPTGQVLFTQANVSVYQEYLDQLPSASNGQLILPNIDLATVYNLTNTTLQGLVPNQDFPIPFVNFRDFFSVMIYFWPGDLNMTNPLVPAGAFQSANPSGYIINYWSLTTANFTNIYKIDGLLARARMLDELRTQLPDFLYYFDSRYHPIWTTQYGNQQINCNSNYAVPGNYLTVYWEMMALQNTLVGSASLPAAR